MLEKLVPALIVLVVYYFLLAAVYEFNGISAWGLGLLMSYCLSGVPLAFALLRWCVKNREE